MSDDDREHSRRVKQETYDESTYNKDYFSQMLTSNTYVKPEKDDEDSLPPEDDEHKYEEEEPKKKKQTRKKSYNSEVYEDEEDEDSVSEDEESYGKKKKGKNLNKKKKRSGAAPKKKNQKKRRGARDFIEDAASDADEEESEDPDDREITDAQQKKFYEEYDRRREMRQKDIKEEDLIKHYEERENSEGEYDEDVINKNSISQMSLQPQISDPKMWFIKCRLGTERECVSKLFHKYFFVKKKNNEELKILSAMSFDSLKGYIYIEAFKEANVREAIQGINAIKENSITVVPMTEMCSIFNYDKVEKINIKQGQWVRIKSGLYEGDLAKVNSIEDSMNRIEIKLVPRLFEGGKSSSIAEYNKRSKKNLRPKQKLFNPKDYDSSLVTTKDNTRGGETLYTYNKNTFVGGFLTKFVRAKNLLVEDIIPKIDELRTFEFVQKDENDEEGENYNLLSKIKSSDLNKRKMFNKGDKVKFIKGPLVNLTGIVENFQDDEIHLRLDNLEGFDDVIVYPSDYFTKHFSPGDHVKVISGSNIGKYGLIVKIEDDTANIFSEDTVSEFRVNCQDIILASHASYEGENNTGYSIDDLVKINGSNTICYVLEAQKHSIKLLDTSSAIKKVSVTDVIKITQNKPHGIDARRNPLNKGDTVKVLGGGNKGLKGVIKNIYKSFCFLYNSRFGQTNGVFVEKTENVEIMGADLINDHDQSSKINQLKVSDYYQNLMGKVVKIVGGDYKGCDGVLKSINNNNVARVELSLKAKIVSVNKSFVKDPKEVGKDTLNNFSNGGRSGAKTPSYYPRGSQTGIAQAQSPSAWGGGTGNMAWNTPRSSLNG